MSSETSHLAAAERLVAHLGKLIDVPLMVRLWDGKRLPVGKPGATPIGTIAIEGPEVMGALLGRPTLDTFFRQFVKGGIELQDQDLLAFFEHAVSQRKTRRPGWRQALSGLPVSAAIELARVTGATTSPTHAFAGDTEVRSAERRDDKAFVQFHYDASNDFYALFLDAQMVYSCAYFEDFANDIGAAQTAKLDLICRKLRLKPGERFLDIGCGWGALLRHAARHYGVQAHGVTLSQAQHDYAKATIEAEGLADRITVELKDFRELTSSYDKIASIGMYEHVGIDNYRAYFKKLRSLLTDDGILLNHGITRRAKREGKRFRRPSATRQIILDYIFPGAELDHVGHTVQVMETTGLEVHDVEGLRRHYAQTCRLWYQRLTAARDAAIAHVGPERFRMWQAYLAGVAIGFETGPLRLFQVVATKGGQASQSPLPPTRADLYAERERAARSG